MKPMEQVPFNFDTQEEPKATTSEVKTEPLEALDEQQLMALYQEKIGVDPLSRSFNRETLIRGITDPKTEKDRLWVIDRASDKEDMMGTYRR